MHYIPIWEYVKRNLCFLLDPDFSKFSGTLQVVVLGGGGELDRFSVRRVAVSVGPGLFAGEKRGAIRKALARDEVLEGGERPLSERKSIESLPIDEETAYRRRAAAYASTKQIQNEPFKKQPSPETVG